MRPDDFRGLFEIDRAAASFPEAARAEPVLATAPFPGEFTETARLDPDRARAEPPGLPPLRRRAGLTVGMLGSLGVHLLPLLLLLHWNSAPAMISAPIPVQLVVEAAPLPPAPEEKPPLPGRRASEDIGDTAAKADKPAAAAAQAADQPDETQLAAALPQPAPAPESAATPEEASPTAHVKPPVKQDVAARLAPNPHPAPRAQVPGPAATRDAYLAYCMTLVRRQFGLLSPSFIAGRHGATSFRLVVEDNGTIANIAVSRSSAYPDIDARIEAAVAAVHRFPPLPQWFQGPRISLILEVSYPEGL